MKQHKCAMCGYKFPIDLMFEVLVCGNCVEREQDDLADSEKERMQLKAENERLRGALEKIVDTVKEMDENWSPPDYGERMLARIAAQALESED